MKLVVTSSLLSLFAGLYMGATAVREKTLHEKNIHSRMINNCMEIIIGKRHKKDICK